MDKCLFIWGEHFLTKKRESLISVMSEHFLSQNRDFKQRSNQSANVRNFIQQYPSVYWALFPVANVKKNVELHSMKSYEWIYN